jgi:hypothetical protein
MGTLLGALPSISLRGGPSTTPAGHPVTETTKSHNLTIIQQLIHPVKPWTLILIFSWLAITALAMNIISDFWIPMLVGALTLALLIKLIR